MIMKVDVLFFYHILKSINISNDFEPTNLKSGNYNKLDENGIIKQKVFLNITIGIVLM